MSNDSMVSYYSYPSSTAILVHYRYKNMTNKNHTFALCVDPKLSDLAGYGRSDWSIWPIIMIVRPLLKPYAHMKMVD